MEKIKRVKTYPETDGTEFYIRTAVFQESVLTLRLELLHSRGQVRELQRRIVSAVSVKNKAKAENMLPFVKTRKAPKLRSQDALDQRDNVISMEEMTIDQIDDSSY